MCGMCVCVCGGGDGVYVWRVCKHACVHVKSSKKFEDLLLSSQTSSFPGWSPGHQDRREASYRGRGSSGPGSTGPQTTGTPKGRADHPHFH